MHFELVFHEDHYLKDIEPHTQLSISNRYLGAHVLKLTRIGEKVSNTVKMTRDFTVGQQIAI